MQRKRPAVHYLMSAIVELLITFGMIFNVWVASRTAAQPYGKRLLIADIVIMLLAFGAFVWALVSYVRARKREQSN